MGSLIDLLPDDITEEEKKRISLKLVETRNRVVKIPSKEEIAKKVADVNERHRSFEAWANTFENRYSSLKKQMDDVKKSTKKASAKKPRKKRNGDQFAQNQLRRYKRELEAKKRELAKDGIIVYDRVFTRLDNTYSVGRRKSLEWNDEIATRGRRKQRKKYRKLKKPDKKSEKGSFSSTGF